MNGRSIATFTAGSVLAVVGLLAVFGPWVSVDPSLLILDEALSALDVTTAASVARLLRQLLRPDTAMLFIGHDLAMVRQLCDQVYVMRRGEIVESGTADEVCGAPEHEYTRLLVASIPRLLPEHDHLGSAPVPGLSPSTPSARNLS